MWEANDQTTGTTGNESVIFGFGRTWLPYFSHHHQNLGRTVICRRLMTFLSNQLIKSCIRSARNPWISFLLLKVPCGPKGWEVSAFHPIFLAAHRQLTTLPACFVIWLWWKEVKNKTLWNIFYRNSSMWYMLVFHQSWILAENDGRQTLNSSSRDYYSLCFAFIDSTASDYCRLVVAIDILRVAHYHRLRNTTRGTRFPPVYKLGQKRCNTLQIAEACAIKN